MNPHESELAGRLYRYKAADRRKLCEIDAQLSNAVEIFKKAASQLECLLARQRNETESVLSRIDVDRVLKLLAERGEVERRIGSANERLRQMGAET